MMAYYEDLTPYEYGQCYDDKTVNIGWIDEIHPYPQGKVTEEFVLSLWEYIKYPINQTRGVYHNKRLDPQTTFHIAHYEGYHMTLGDAEIRVVDVENDLIYAAPNLILHYIITHQYLPPDQFINAMIKGPKPNSDIYSQSMSKLFRFGNKYYHGLRKNLECKFCSSNYGNLGHSHVKDASVKSSQIIINTFKPDYDDLDKEKLYYNFICEDCGKVSEIPDSKFD